MDLKTAIETVDRDYFELTGDHEDRVDVVTEARRTVDAAELTKMADSGEAPEVVDAYRVVIEATDQEIIDALNAMPAK